MRPGTCIVLIIDDSPDDREMVRHALLRGSERRYVFLEAGTGERGVEACRVMGSELPDCVVLDLNLPDMQGLQVLHELSNGTSWLPFPVVVLTDVRNQDEAEKAIQAGAQDLMVKEEMTPDSLTRAINHSLERYKLAAALQDSERRFRQTFENAPIGIIKISPGGKLLSVNPVFGRIVGFSNDELLGRNVFDLTHAEDLEAERARARSMLEGEADSYILEKRYIRKNGALVWVSLTVTAARDHDGRLLYALGIVEDVNARKQAEIACSQSEERLRLAVEAGRMGVWDWWLGTGLVLWNECHYGLLGYRVGEVQPTYEVFRSRVHPDDLARLERTHETAMRDHTEYRCEHRVVWPDGSEHWLESLGRFHYDERGKPERMYGVLIDTTEKKRTEQVLRESDRRKDEFLAMLAHELRNPIAAIGCALELIRYKGIDDDDVGWGLDVVDRQVEHLSRLIDDLLDISRITRGKVELRKEHIDVRDVIRLAVEAVRPLIVAKKHELIVSTPNVPLDVLADQTRLEQVVGNLLSNAAKYTDEGGKIVVEASVEGDKVVIRVNDSGIGIPPQMLSQIFDLFTQVDTSLDRSQGGLGIGLTLVRTLVEMHGGSVSAASEGPGKGSEFTIRLPVLHADELAGG
jgi:PAS domain S-box-containing protein